MSYLDPKDPKTVSAEDTSLGVEEREQRISVEPPYDDELYDPSIDFGYNNTGVAVAHGAVLAAASWNANGLANLELPSSDNDGRAQITVIGNYAAGDIMRTQIAGLAIALYDPTGAPAFGDTMGAMSTTTTCVKTTGGNLGRFWGSIDGTYCRLLLKGSGQGAVTSVTGINGTTVAPTTGDVVVDASTTKLDDFATPDDNTDLNATVTEHGLMPKLSGTGLALTGNGTFAKLDHGDHIDGLLDDDHTQYVLRNILTTKGDIFARGSAAITRLAVGAAGKYLKADPAAATGLSYDDPAGTAEPLGVSPCGGYVTTDGSDLWLDYAFGGRSDKIWIYDGSDWIARVLDPANKLDASMTGSNTIYYLYAYWSSPNVLLEASTTAPIRQDGIRVKTGATTYLLVAVCRSNASSLIVDAVGQRLINNVYNKRWKQMYAQESTDSWAYGTAAYRPLNNSTANRIEFVADGENLINVRVAVWTFTATAQAGYVGIGLDSVVANHAIEMAPGCSTAQPTGTAEAQYKSIVAEGYHYLQALEYASGANVTFYGDSGVPAIWQEALMGEILC